MEEALIFGIIVGTLFATIILTNAHGLISLIADAISAVFNFCWAIVCLIFKVIEIIVLAIVEIIKRIFRIGGFDTDITSNKEQTATQNNP